MSRAASEVLGYVLVFTLISATVGVVYVSGFGGLQEARAAERIENAERAFDVLADNMDDIVRRNAPARATEVKLSEATLSLGEPTEVTVTIDDGASTTTVGPREVRPVVLEAGDGSAVVYEAGAVFRVDRGGAVMNVRPGFVFGTEPPSEPNPTVLNIPETSASETTAVGGSTTVLVRGELDTSTEEDLERSAVLFVGPRGGGPYQVTLEMATTPARAEPWERYLEARIVATHGGSDPCSVSAGTVTCAFQSESVHVATTVIDVSIEE